MRILLLAALLFTGCATSHRTATATHEHRTYSCRSDGMVSLDIWKDSERGGGVFFLTDPQVTSVSVIHTNMPAIGGGSAFSAGPMSLHVDPQASAIIGSVVEGAVKAAISMP